MLSVPPLFQLDPCHLQVLDPLSVFHRWPPSLLTPQIDPEIWGTPLNFLPSHFSRGILLVPAGYCEQNGVLFLLSSILETFGDLVCFARRGLQIDLHVPRIPFLSIGFPCF